ncbi:MAG TPA: M20/M25/M40 family metallo-hydrolase [Thermoanaerobaculia bacterium]|nr:M20/M25/M40 family metallo-hydrolase [Thermoanaerobaculia bacterium]
MKRLPMKVIAGAAILFTMALAMPTEAAGTLTAEEKKIVAWVDVHHPAAVSLLEEAVRIPSATLNFTGVRKVGDLFAERYRAIGFETRWLDLPPEVNRAGHLFAERHGKRGRKLLLIGHLDTVIESSPVVREGMTLRGNGGSDMKGGDVIMLYALEALAHAGVLRDTAIIVALTGDEEDPGKPLKISRRELIDAARRSDLALAFEGTVENTGTVARRGFTSWKLETSARGGHSSGIFTATSGSGAVFEAARILDRFYQEVRGEEYLTFNPSVIVGGTDVAMDDDVKKGTADGKLNVIPKQVVVEGDLRFLTNTQRDRTEEKMRAIVEQHLPGTSAIITFNDGYPAMEPTEGNHKLLKVFDQVSRDLGFGEVTPLDPSKRGAGDVSFVAPIIDCLDGLGAKGEREHSADEWVDMSSIPMLIKRAALLIYRLSR